MYPSSFPFPTGPALDLGVFSGSRHLNLSEQFCLGIESNGHYLHCFIPVSLRDENLDLERRRPFFGRWHCTPGLRRRYGPRSVEPRGCVSAGMHANVPRAAAPGPWHASPARRRGPHGRRGMGHGLFLSDSFLETTQAGASKQCHVVVSTMCITPRRYSGTESRSRRVIMEDATTRPIRPALARPHL